MIRKKILLSALAGIVLSVNLNAKELDRVYAIVNEDVITKSEYDQEYINTTLELEARGRQIPAAAALRRQILDRMIGERLQLQIANRVGIQVSPAQVEDAVKTIAERNQLNVQQLKEALSNDGVSYDSFSKRIEHQITIQELVERQINARVVISDQEVDEFLSTESSGTGLNSEFNVSHIVVPIVEQDANGFDDARSKIEKARQAIEEGLEFNKAASEYSAYEDAIEGGALGWRKSGELPNIYYQALRLMSEGEISDILQTESAFHIVKLNETRTAGSESDQKFTQLRVRQIFLEFDQNSNPEFMRLRLNEIAERLSKGEDFATLAEFYSEDAPSRIKGGDLGWLSPGDLGSNIENILNRMPVGQVSEPIQFGNGISIFEVIEKRQRSAGNLFEKNAAREQLHVRKAEKMYQDWLQGLRDTAYVQYLVDDLN